MIVMCIHVTEFLSSFLFPLFIYIFGSTFPLFLSLFICTFCSNRLNWKRKNISIKYNLLWLLVPICSSKCHHSRWSKSLVSLCILYVHDNNNKCLHSEFLFNDIHAYIYVCVFIPCILNVAFNLNLLDWVCKLTQCTWINDNQCGHL